MPTAALSNRASDASKYLHIKINQRPESTASAVTSSKNEFVSAKEFCTMLAERSVPGLCLTGAQAKKQA